MVEEPSEVIEDKDEEKREEAYIKYLEEMSLIREKEFQEEKQEIDELISKATSDEELEKIKQIVSKTEKLYALDMWLKLFSRRSFLNEIPAQIAYHVHLGQRLKYLRIRLKDKKFLDWREHATWIQGSGSGKGELMNLFWEISDGATIVLNPLAKPAYRPATVKKLGRLKTPALINTAHIDKKGLPAKDEEGNMIMKRGILSRYDFIILEEARQLLTPEPDALDIQEIFMTVSEPIGTTNNIYTKDLTNYEEGIDTCSTSSWFGTSRPLGKMRNTLVSSGLLQRSLFYARRIEDQKRKEMNEMSALSSYNDKQSNFDEDFSNLIKELEKVVDFASKNEISIKEKDVAIFIKEKMDYFQNDLLSISNDVDKEIIQTFISRYRNHMIILAHHFAATRYSKNVEKQDIEYAFNLVSKLYNNLKLWVETSVEQDKDIEKDVEGYIETIKKVVNLVPGIKFNKLVKEVMKVKRKQYPTIAYNIKKFSKGDNKLITIDEDKNVFLAKS